MKTEFASMAEARAEYLRQGYRTVNYDNRPDEPLTYHMFDGQHNVTLQKTGLLHVVAIER